MDEIQTTPTASGYADRSYAYGLTEREVLRLKDIIQCDCDVGLSIEEAWGRAIELIALARMLIEAELPAEVRC